MSDLIDRQIAIDALGEKPVGKTDWDLGCINQWEWDTEILRTLPSTEPEERAAKVKEGWGFAMCCACKKRVFPCDEYCSHCGARLEWNE